MDSAGKDSMAGSAPGTPATASPHVQAQIFEVVAHYQILTGPIHHLARQFGVTPITFMDCLGGLVYAGWVIVTASPDSVFTIELDRDARART